MKVKPLLHVILCIHSSCYSESYIRENALTMARGRSSMCINGPFSVTGNPSRTAFEKKPSAGISTSNYYMLGALQYHTITALYPHKTCAFSGSYTQSGNRSWNQSHASVHTAYAFSEAVSFSAGACFESLVIPAYGRARSYTATISVFCSINPVLTSGLVCKGLFSGRQELLYSQAGNIQWGLSYLHEKHLRFHTEIALLETGINLIPSMEYLYNKALCMAAGINFSNREIGFGISYLRKNCSFSAACLYNLYTGISSSLSIACAIKS